jgi:hypothetical protein
MIKAIFTIAEDDLQDVARDCIGRELTEEELRIVIKNFEFGIEWYETAKVAVEEAVGEEI